MRSFADCVCINATSSGTGAFSLGSAVAGYFGREALTDGAIYSYCVQQGNNVEVGQGTYNATAATLSRTPSSSTNGGAAVDFDVNAAVAITFTAADIADLLAAAVSGSAATTAKAAFNTYGLQWGVWFNATPVAGEVLALFTTAVAMTYPANFAGSVAGEPGVVPAATFVLSVEHQPANTSGWAQIGTVTVAPAGSVDFATVGAEPVAIGSGDQLRVVAPLVVDAAIEQLSFSLKGFVQ